MKLAETRRYRTKCPPKRFEPSRFFISKIRVFNGGHLQLAVAFVEPEGRARILNRVVRRALQKVQEEGAPSK